MSQRPPYFAYTTRSRLDKSINSLLGIVQGIGIDGVVNERERGYLEAWTTEHADVAALHPFSELIPVVTDAVADGILSEEERADLQWLCERLRSDGYYDRTTADLQRLQAVLGGIASDAEISKAELLQLRIWLDAHDHLRSCWPYDEVSSLITGVLSDGRIDAAEHELLRAFFGEFGGSRVGLLQRGEESASATGVAGVCASCPEITFAGMRFCFTGESRKFTRQELFDTVTRLGGTVVSGVSGKLDFLVVGADGNPCWAYACYGRKIERAVELRKAGARIVLVHENDFQDAVADHR